MWLYETNGNIFKVSRWLGHKSVQNTERYIHLWQELFPENIEYEYKIIKKGANQTEEAVEWQRRGWIHDYNAPNGDIVLKRPKSLNLGSPTNVEGSSASLV